MHDQQSHRRVPLGVVAGLSVLVVATGSAVAWWGWHSVSRNAPAPSAVQPADPAQPDDGRATSPNAALPGEAQKPQTRSAPLTTEKTLRVYWLKGTGNEIALTPAPVKLSSTGDTSAGLKTALDKLLAGPTSESVTTTIPQATQLQSFAIREDGIHISLSKEFASGGGSSSMTARVAQVLYTATSLNPNAQVWLEIDGKPLETLGGEGLVLDQPLTRKSFERDFSL